MSRGILGAAMLLFAASSAAASIEQIHIGAPHRALYAIDFDGDQGYAVGARGRVMHSGDGGGSWSVQPAVTELSLLAVATRGEHRIAVGQTGLALRSDADGRWTPVDTGTTERLMAVDVDADGRAVAAGSFGALLRSEDGGAAWTRVAVDWGGFVEGGFEPHLYAVQAMGEGVFVITGEYGLILRSTDGGRSWSKLHGGDASLFAVHIREDGVGYAVGQSGVVLKTSDRGLHWAPMESGTTANLLGVWSTAKGRVVVPGMRHLLTSDDDGLTWRHETAGDVGRIWTVGTGAAAGSDSALAVGQSERIIRVGGGR